jgi:hypothetical protein
MAAWLMPSCISWIFPNLNYAAMEASCFIQGKKVIISGVQTWPSLLVAIVNKLLAAECAHLPLFERIPLISAPAGPMESRFLLAIEAACCSLPAV